MKNKLMTEEDVVEYVKQFKVDISVSQLQRMRWKGYSGSTPKLDSTLVVGKVRYRKADVDKWVEGL